MSGFLIILSEKKPGVLCLLLFLASATILGCPTTTGTDDGSGDTEETPPTLTFEFEAESTDWLTGLDLDGEVSFGAALTGPTTATGARLTLSGNAALGAADATGPATNNEIRSSRSFLFGTFRTRVRLPECAPTEEVVSGIFLYANDDVSDTNENGIVDNNEIDFEILCGEPTILYMSSWTDYEDDSNFLKVSRAVDLETGEAYQTAPGAEGSYGLADDPVETISGARVPGTALAGDFFELGFTWETDRIRFFIVLDGEEVTLWDFQDARFIPQNPAAFHYNLWHSEAHWWSGEPADFPASDATLEIDWLKYWE